MITTMLHRNRWQYLHYLIAAGAGLYQQLGSSRQSAAAAPASTQTPRATG
ncbi:MAG: hypothetical protein KF832_04815 [Caldilineaceae bacterium]|nr:hypothetical protein [Caldilineaceae bacterium]